MTVEWNISQTLIDYPLAIAEMESRVAAIHLGAASELVWLLEHPPLYTSGTSAKAGDLLTPNRFPVYEAGRGGQYTYHGPGQQIAYVMMDLKKRDQDLRKFVKELEQWLINSLGVLGVKGERREGRVGIWVATNDGSEAKIAALGIRVRKWITFHGISLNINPDLEHFSGIIPCGIRAHGVTSLVDLGIDIDKSEISIILQEQFTQIFGDNDPARSKTRMAQ